jgi:hypothetical protein
MKKVTVLIIALFTMTLSAQEKSSNEQDGHRGRQYEAQLDLTPEEFSQLQTKKMTLSLDLNEVQQKEISQINLENAKRRMAKMEARKNEKQGDAKERPTKEERLKRTNERLDAQIANKKKMKSILNDTQYKKWEKQSARKHGQKRKSHNKKKDGKKGMMRQR